MFNFCAQNLFIILHFFQKVFDRIHATNQDLVKKSLKEVWYINLTLFPQGRNTFYHRDSASRDKAYLVGIVVRTSFMIPKKETPPLIDL